MRILYVTQYFPPEVGAPQVRILELMRHMIRLGHEITILTAMPNYPRGAVFPEYRGKLLLTERFEHMNVVRTWMYPTTSLNMLKRTWSQMSFAVASAFLGPLKLRQYDIMLVGSPPLFLAISALLLTRFTRCPYMMVVADLWPEVAIETGMLRSPLAIRMARWLEKTFYRNALAVLTQTPGQADSIRARFPSTRTHVVSGAVDTEMFSPSRSCKSIRRELGVDGETGVLYFGLHGFAQGLDVVLAAAARLSDRDDIRIIMIGTGAVKAELTRKAAESGLKNLRFLDPVPRERIPAIVASMDICLIPLRKGVPKATMPTKMYESMASGVAVIVSADGESYELVKRERLGIAVPAGAAEELADAIAMLADNPSQRQALGANGVRVAHERFDRKLSARQLHEFLLRTVPGNGKL